MPSGDADPVRPPCSLTLQRRPPTILGTHREAAASSYKLSRVSKGNTLQRHGRRGAVAERGQRILSRHGLRTLCTQVPHSDKR